MRNLLLASTLLFSAVGCSDEIAPLPEPPVLKVTSPARSTIREGAGQVVVQGTVSMNAERQSPIKSVKVNGVSAVVGADGAFQATINVTPGATLIHTEAVDDGGGTATDTRSIEAGELRAPGSNIENAVTMAISKQAFAKVATAASTMIKGMDFKTMLTPMNPMYSAGLDATTGAEDCLFAKVNVTDFKMSGATITMVPVNGGLSFSAKLDGVDVPGSIKYAAACLDGNDTTRIQAQSIMVRGTLLVTPDGMNGFKTDLADETVQITGLNISASGVPGAVLSILPLESVIESLAPTAARMFMAPMMNKALGGLGGPKQLDVLGKQVTVQVSPSDIAFDSEGGLVTLDMRMLIGGAESGKGFIFTDNGYPSMDPGQGMQVGLADDLANSVLSQVVTTGLLNIHMEQHGGSFDGSDMAATSPPMISADPATGMMRLVLPDLMTTFTSKGRPVGKAAINATVELKISPSNNGYGVAIELGKPTIHADVLDEIPNETMLTDADLGDAVELSLQAQIASISALLGAIPLPAMPGGLSMKDMSVSSDDGYVMMRGTLE
jgi:Glucodextranase, domain B